MTGKRVDGVRIGRDHSAPAAATRLTTEESYVAADAFLRRSPSFSDAHASSLARSAVSPQRFRIALPIEEVLGPDFTRRVEGVRRIGGFGSTEWADVDFGDGRVVAIYEIQTDGQVRLITLYPEGD